MITINVEDKTWEELNKRKKAGETFDEVINKLIQFEKGGKDAKSKKDK